MHSKFDLRLIEVDPPGWISTAKGTPDSTIYEFHDNRLHFEWAITSGSRLNFVLQNLSRDSIRVRWEQVRYVDQNLDSQRVFHSGIRLNERSLTRSDAIVKPLGKLVDFILPEQLVIDSPYKRGAVLREEPLIGLDDTNPRRMRREAASLRGSSVQVLMPVVAKGATRIYRFTFQIDRVTIE